MADQPLTTNQPPTQPRRTFMLGAWGNQANQQDAQGNDIAGTSGANQDENRYRNMSQVYQPDTPTIDQQRTGESRAIGMGSLGMIQNRANGGMTPAQQMQAQQTSGAVNAVNSGAASIRGGAMARAAAARGAQNVGARVQAQGNQDQAALAAREQADAAGQLYTASSAQRAADLGLAGEQAKLEMQHRAAQDQHEATYEGMNIDTKNAQVSHLLGRSAADQAAQNAANATNNAADANRQANLERMQSGATGAFVGGLNAYGNTQRGGGGGSPSGPTPAQQPYNSGSIIHENPYGEDDPYGGSDPAMKTKIVPLYEDAGSGIERHWDADVSKAKPDVTSGASLSAPTPKYSSAPKSTAATPKARVQERARKMTDAELERAARDLQANTEAQQTQLGAGPSVHDRTAAPAAAPPGLMTADDVYGPRGNDSRLAMSDPKAKTEAFYMGMEHAHNPDAAPMPDYVKSAPKTAQVTYGEQKREPRALAKGGARGLIIDHQPTGGKESSRPMQYDLPPMDMYAARPEEQEPVPPPAAAAPMPPQQPPSYFGQASQMAARMTSDPKAKKDVGDSPMAASNRSMVPSVYEYKAEFTPPEQKPGEKNVGPMADKMEANPVASTAIVKDPQTGLLAIDKTKGLKLALGGLADLQFQVDRLKRQSGRR